MVLIGVAVALLGSTLFLVGRWTDNTSTLGALFTFLLFYLFTFPSASFLLNNVIYEGCRWPLLSL